MRKRTTTQSLYTAITNNLLKVTKSECYYKTSRKTEPVDNSTLIENLQFLCESGYFTDCIGWIYEKNFKTNDYIAECGRTDGYAENIVIVHFRAGDGVSDADIEEVLKVEETEE